MASKKVTINQLAVMVQKGFDAVYRGFEETAKKADMNLKFEQVNKRFDRIEKILIAEQNRRIKKIEDEIKEMKGSLALIFK